jgi:hypothetical protein
MNWDKDIRFPEKKVDDSWKEQVVKDPSDGKSRPAQSQSSPAASPKASPASSKQPTSKPFINLISSLGFQALLHMGEIPNPDTQAAEFNPQAAREMIDLLIAVRDKTKGNLSDQEEEMLTQLLAELQMKFAQKI